MSQCLLISLSFTWRVLSSQEPKNQKIHITEKSRGRLAPDCVYYFYTTYNLNDELVILNNNSIGW